MLRHTKCEQCQKKTYGKESHARRVIAAMLRQGATDHSRSFMLNTYFCEASQGWHIGHDVRVGRVTSQKPLLKGKPRHAYAYALPASNAG